VTYLSIFAVSFAIALSGALAPGPLLAAVIYESTRHGWYAGPMVVLGHAIIEVIMVALIMLGVTRFINNPFALKMISFAGAFILLYFGIQMPLSLSRSSLAMETKNKKRANLTAMGITLSIANPYWGIWWLSIGLGLVLAAQQKGFLAVGVFFLGHILADLGWYSAVSLTFSKGKRFISDTAYKIILGICACVLVGFSVRFVLAALKSN
jgi:threonine/homoserine/homoserine lactone efflux protein